MKWARDPRTAHLFYSSVFVFAVSVVATVSYMLNGWGFDDAFYMTVLTIFTVGYEEVRPVDTVTLRLVTGLLIIVGCTGMIYLTGALVQFITFGQLQELLGATRMTRQIEYLEDHVIVCGFGRTGNMLAKELTQGKAKLVVIEPNQSRCLEAKAMGYLTINADAIEENVLRQAGIAKARALASVVSSDPINVFITLSARSLNQSIQIIARGEEPSTEKKLLQAGANAVILPTHIGAEQIASLILFPAIAGVIQATERRRQMDVDLRTLGLEIEVVAVAEGSLFAGRSIEEIERRAESAFIIIAIERLGSNVVERPQPHARVYPGDGVTVIGRPGRAEALEKFTRPVPLEESEAVAAAGEDRA
ncbi:MAG: potassium channel protein [Methylocystis sp.]|nr:MAG: potassium channel protein [Methylocystis sp.]